MVVQPDNFDICYGRWRLSFIRGQTREADIWAVRHGEHTLRVGEDLRTPTNLIECIEAAHQRASLLNDLDGDWTRFIVSIDSMLEWGWV